MTTIPQLPPAIQVDPADEFPISQAGLVHSVSVGQLLAGTQPAITAATGTLLGRVSLGPGGPEPVALGAGLGLAAGALTATGTDHAGFAVQSLLQPVDQAVISSGGAPMLLRLATLRGLFSAGANVAIDQNGVISAGAGAGGGGNAITVLPVVTSIGAGDLVGISQGGADHVISYANFLDGQTIDQSPAAAAASDADVVWVGQGSNVLARQTLAALWSWIAGHLPGFHRPVIEITANTALDGSVHNGALLVCSAPVTLTPAFINMGSGFFCDVVNLSGGTVSFAAGITTSSGVSTLANGQSASLRAATFSGGSVVYAAVSTAGAQPVPGQVSALTSGTASFNAVPLTWTPPSSGGAPATYSVQYRVSGTLPWSTASSAVPGPGFTVGGLSALTAYDFQVLAANAAGSGPASAPAHASTPAAPAVPGQPAGLSVGTIGPNNVALSWSVPPAGGPVAAYTVQFRVTGGALWSTASASVVGAGWTVTGLIASTGYDFQVFATNVSGAGPVSATVSATTAPAVPGQVVGLGATASGPGSVTLAWSPPTIGGAPSSYTIQYRVAGSSVWTTASSTVVGLSYGLTGLAASTAYEFEAIAVNVSGAGTASPTATATTAAGALVAPGQVSGLTAPGATSSSVSLTWNPPAGGGAVSTYTVQYRFTGSSVWSTATTAATVASSTVNGLAPSTGYDFQVIAVNAAGGGPASAVATATTAAALALPGQVTGVVAAGPTTSSVSLSWSPPASGGAVATYTVQYRASGTTPWSTAAASVTGTSLTVTGLAAATGYDFQVIAINAAGSGPASALATAMTTSSLAVPGAVAGLTAGTATASTLPLSWTAPATGGAVASYTVQYRIHGATAWSTASTTVSGTSFVVSGLAAATSYDVQVFAVNAAGNGATAAITAATASAASFTIVPGFLPPASTYAHGQTSIGINMKCDPSPPGNVLNFGWSSSASVAPSSWAGSASNFNVDYFGAYITAPASAGTYYFWAQTTDAAGSYVSAAISVT